MALAYFSRGSTTNQDMVRPVGFTNCYRSAGSSAPCRGRFSLLKTRCSRHFCRCGVVVLAHFMSVSFVYVGNLSFRFETHIFSMIFPICSHIFHKTYVFSPYFCSPFFTLAWTSRIHGQVLVVCSNGLCRESQQPGAPSGGFFFPATESRKETW